MWCVALGACAAAHDGASLDSSDKAIFNKGFPKIQEYYESNATVQRAMRESSVALVANWSAEFVANNEWTKFHTYQEDLLVALSDDAGLCQRLGPWYLSDHARSERAVAEARVNGFCSEVPFQDQPMFADCSGYLIDSSERAAWVQTAGHCLLKADTCDDLTVVFGAYRENGGTPDETGRQRLVRPGADVYPCRRVVARRWEKDFDYAIVEIDAVDSSHQPIKLPAFGETPPVAPSQVASSTTSIAFNVGHPRGLPAKSIQGNVLRVGAPYYFEHDASVFVGNSGGMLMMGDGERAMAWGHHVRSKGDYILTRATQTEKQDQRSQWCVAHRTHFSSSSNTPPKSLPRVQYSYFAAADMCLRGFGSVPFCARVLEELRAACVRDPSLPAEYCKARAAIPFVPGEHCRNGLDYCDGNTLVNCTTGQRTTCRGAGGCAFRDGQYRCAAETNTKPSIARCARFEDT